MDTKSVIHTVEAYIDDIKQHGYDISNAYLFGGYAKGVTTEESDIDVAILMHGITETWKMQIEMMKIRRAHDIRIEPHVFSIEDNNSPFLKEIISTGILIGS
jgi:uncharacterized protein